MYSVIIAHYVLLVGQYTFTNTSLYFGTLWMGPPQWRSCLKSQNHKAKCFATDTCAGHHRETHEAAFGFNLESSNPQYVIIGGESHIFFDIL
jgi:hypothetical protein